MPRLKVFLNLFFCFDWSYHLFFHSTEYFAEYAEEVPSGATCRALSKAAAEAGVCVVGGTVPERCGNKLYNTCTVWDCTGKLLAQYRKVCDGLKGHAVYYYTTKFEQYFLFWNCFSKTYKYIGSIKLVVICFC